MLFCPLTKEGCLKNCALYNHKYDACSIAVIAERLEALYDIEDRLRG